MSLIDSSQNGISGEINATNETSKIILITFVVIAWYNVIELVVLVLSTFRHWRGYYFWCLMVSGVLGVAPYSAGFVLKFFTATNPLVSVTILTLGWWAMITGQSFVLYSRLHLVVSNPRTLRRVFYMILTNVLILHVPTSVLTYASNIENAKPAFINGYNIMEKIQMTGFTIQEAIISGLYVSETVRLLRLGSERSHRKIMHELVGINVFIILMDIALLGLEYASIYALQITLKAAIYSVKLKLEFAVLGKLVDMIHRPGRQNNSVRLYSVEHGNSASVVAAPDPWGNPNDSGLPLAAVASEPAKRRNYMGSRDDLIFRPGPYRYQKFHQERLDVSETKYAWIQNSVDMLEDTIENFLWTVGELDVGRRRPRAVHVPGSNSPSMYYADYASSLPTLLNHIYLILRLVRGIRDLYLTNS